MRYYIYLDREFLRILFSVLGEDNFNIEVLEYSLRKSVTTNNELSLEPSLENINDCENSCKNESEKSDLKYLKNGEFNKEKLEVSYDKSKSCNVQTEIKYINIEDVSDIKNTSFYHKLLEDLRKNINDNTSRIVEEVGYIKIENSLNRIEVKENNDDFFMINESFVWIDNTKLQGNLKLLSLMGCEIKVIGYMMNCKNSNNGKILKAIAIFIE